MFMAMIMNEGTYVDFTSILERGLCQAASPLGI